MRFFLNKQRVKRGDINAVYFLADRTQNIKKNQKIPALPL